MSGLQKLSSFLKTRIFFCVGVLGLFLLAAPFFSYKVLAASAPNVVTYQGRLLLTSGAPVTSAQNMQFLIYDALTNGNLLYTAAGTTGAPTTISVTPSNGLFTIDLGGAGTNSLAPDLFKDNSTLYLEVHVGAETLSPRKRLASSPYAFNAKYLDGVGANTNSTTVYIPVSDASGNFNFNQVTSTNFISTATSSLATATDAALRVGGQITYPGSPKLQVYTTGQEIAALVSLNAAGALNFVRSNGGVTYSTKGSIGYGTSGFFSNSSASSFNILGNGSGPTLIGSQQSVDAPFVITQDNKIGIGTLTPTTLFQVSGTSTLATTTISSSTISTLNVGDLNVTGVVTGISSGGGDVYLSQNQTFTGLNVFGATTTFTTTTISSSSIQNANINNLNVSGNVSGIDLSQITGTGLLSRLDVNQNFSALNFFSATTTLATTTISSSTIRTLNVGDLNVTGVVTGISAGGGDAFLGNSQTFTGVNTFSATTTFTTTTAASSTVRQLNVNGNANFSGNVGIGTSTPAAKLVVQGGAILAEGATGGTPFNGSGTRLMWIPSKAAFRAGRTVDSWEDADIGNDSAAFGYNNKISATYSFGAGHNNTVLSDSSVVFGETNIISAGGSTGSAVFGGNNTVQGANSFVSGYLNTIDASLGSTIFGENNHVTSSAHGMILGGKENGLFAADYGVALGQGMTVSAAHSMGINLYGDSTNRTLSQANTMAIMGGSLGIGTLTPTTLFEVFGTSTLATTTISSSTIASLNVGNLNIGGSLTGISVGDAYLTHDQTFSGLNIFSATTTFATTTVASTSIQTANISNLNVGQGLDVSGSTTLHNPLFISGTNGSNFDMGSAGTYFQWIPNKGAFRAGLVEADQWATGNIAAYSAAFGKNNTITAVGGFAAGTGNTVWGGGSDGFAAGTGNNVSGGFGTLGAAFGNNNVITYPSGFAAGTNNHVDGIGTAFGNGNYIDAGVIDGFAAGRGSRVHAGGSYSFAAGYIAQVSGESSGAFGESVSSTANNSFVFGKQMLVSGANSFGVNLNNTYTALSQANTMAIMGGNMGVGIVNPSYRLTVDDTIAVQSGTGKITLKATNTTSTLTSTVTDAAGSAAFSFESNTTLTDATDRALAVFKNGDGLVKVAISGGGEVAAKGTFHANDNGYGIGDVAENVNLVPGTNAEAGDVLVASQNGLVQFEKSSDKYAQRVAGVITDTGKFVMGASGKNRAPLALSGLVNVKVSDENGPVQVGDYLVTASKSGYAMKYVPSPEIKEAGLVGMALQPLTSGEGRINALIMRGVAYGSSTSSSTPAGLVSNSIESSISNPEQSNGFSGIFSALAIVGSNNNWKIDENGNIIAKSIKADKITAKELIIDQGDNATNSTLGEGIILQGQHSVVISNTKATSLSKIFVTFVKNPKVSWWVSKKDNGSFEVSLDQLAGEDLQFDYWIIGTTGNPVNPVNNSGNDLPVVSVSSSENGELVASSTPMNEENSSGSNSGSEVASSTPEIASSTPEIVSNSSGEENVEVSGSEETPMASSSDAGMISP